MNENGIRERSKGEETKHSLAISNQFKLNFLLSWRAHSYRGVFRYIHRQHTVAASGVVCQQEQRQRRRLGRATAPPRIPNARLKRANEAIDQPTR